MKVAMVHAEWLPVPPALGGPIEQTLYETALTLRAPKLTVISRWDEALNSFGKGPSDIFYHVDIDAEISRVRSVLGARTLAGLQDSTTYFCYLNGATELLRQIDPDVIQIHNRPAFVPYMLKQFPDKQIVLYMHGEAQYLPNAPENLFAQVISSVTRFVFVSHFLADRFGKQYPESVAKTTVIHNSVNTDVWHPKVKEGPQTKQVQMAYGLRPGRTVLFMGRTVYEKGVHCLLKAMAWVRHEIPDVKLLIVGSPFFDSVETDPYLAALKQAAVDLGDGVVFTGYVDHAETPAFYAAADVTVVPSVWEEPFGKVVVESMAVGVPVVGSRRGGIPEIITDGQDGVLVDDPEDAGALGQAIIDLLQNDPLRQKMGTAARKKVVKKFAKPMRMKRLKSLYRSLGNENRATKRLKV